ncbi:MAG: ATP-binding protein, partial [Methyloligellaceae bacterium]
KELGLSLGHRRILLAAISDLVQSERSRELSTPVHGHSGEDDAERRQLTVMFCDLVGSTELSRQLDPEEMRDLLRRYQDAVSTAIQRYQGHVAKFLGDGVLAYFGWPQAYEDQAERAVRAGLDAVTAVEAVKVDGQQRLHARVGIDTGQVVVGDLVGDTTSDAEAVIGETPNLAARLQGIAQIGQVVIGSKTRSLLGTTFELEDIGPQQLKGYADAVHAWSVIREGVAEGRFEAAHGGRLTGLVGREGELGLLRERWELANGGDGQVVLLSGEAGIGKSRIVQDLRQEIGDQSCSLLYYQCSPHHTNSAFHPIVQRLRRVAGFTADDDSAAKLDKLEAMFRARGDDIRDVVPLFSKLLSLPGEDRYGPLDVSPQQFRNKIIELLIGQVIWLSQRKPAFCIIEDVHWIDPSMAEFIGEMMPRIADQAALLLITYRPDFTPSWLDHSHVNSIALNRLGRGQTAEIVHSVGGSDLMDAIVEQIVLRSDGVPLYVEELTKSVLESLTSKNDAAVDEVIPATLQSSLVARLDRLDEAKEIAQIGAVIGREFSHGLIGSLVNKSDAELTADLDRLVRSGLVSRQGTPPDATYTFKHSLVQDAAYATILMSRRYRLHARIVESLEARTDSQANERLTTLAYHAFHGEVWDKAFSYLRRAGLDAMDRSALREAAAQLEQALIVASHLPETEETLQQTIDLRFELRNALWALGRFEAILKHLGDAERLADQLDDARRAGWISVFESASLWQLGRSKKAVQTAENALTVSKKAGDLSLEVAANFYLGCAYVTSGDCPRAEALFETVAKLLVGDLSRERCGLPFAPAVISRSWLVWALAERGEFEQGLAHGHAALELAEEIEHPFNLAHIYYDLGYFFEIQGDLPRAVDALEKAYGLVEEWSLTYLSPFIMGFLGHVYAISGREEDGVRLLKRAQAAYQTMGLGLFRSLVGIQLGEAHLLHGETDEALLATNQALELAGKRGERGHQAYGLRLLGDIAAHPDRLQAETAISCYEQSRALAEELRMRPLVAQCHLGLGKLYEHIDRPDEAGGHAETALTMSRDMNMSFWQDARGTAV